MKLEIYRKRKVIEDWLVRESNDFYISFNDGENFDMFSFVFLCFFVKFNFGYETEFYFVFRKVLFSLLRFFILICYSSM